MKSIKNIVITILLATATFGCTTGFEELQKSPNEPARWEIAPITLLEEILYQASYDLMGHTLTLNGELMQYSVNSNISRYKVGPSTSNQLWNGYYDIFQDADHIIQLAQLIDKKDVNLQAIGLTMKAFTMSIITDIFGDAPCSEAAKSRPYLPREATSLDEICNDIILTPKYDTQKEIYEQMLSWLEEANSLYKTNQALPTVSRDLLYGGDISKWKKFTNSLQVRLLMRLSNRDNEMGVGTKLCAMLADPDTYPLFDSNEDSAVLYYSNELPFVNRYAEGSTLNKKYSAEAIIYEMNRSSDPRISCYFKKSGSWAGAESGEVISGVDRNSCAKLNKTTLASYTSPYAYMKYDELCLLLSEAAMRGLIDGGEEKAKEYYEKGITSSIVYWYQIANKTGGETAAATFLAGRGIFENTLTQILTQQWVSNFWVGFEAWCTYRRTGYPKLVIGSAVYNNGVLPTRFIYAVDATTTNVTQSQIAIDRMVSEYGIGDTMETPLWWSYAATN